MDEDTQKLISVTLDRADRMLAILNEDEERSRAMATLVVLVTRAIARNYPEEEFAATLVKMLQTSLQGAPIYYAQQEREGCQ